MGKKFLPSSGLDAYSIPSDRILPDMPGPDMSAGVPFDSGPGPGALTVSADDPHVAAYLAGRPMPTRGAPIHRSYATVSSDEYLRASQIVVDGSGDRYTPSMWEKFLQNAPPEPVVERHARFDDLEFGEDLKGSWITYVEKLTAGDFAKTHLNGFTLPGHGTVYDSCGAFMVMGCLGAPGSVDDGRTAAQLQSELKHHEASADVLRGRTQVCGRLSCPTCLEHSINRSAMAAARRMFAYLLLLRTKLFAEHQPIAEKAKRVLQHYVVSVPPRDHARLKDDPAAVKAQVLRDLRALGLRGGASVYHPWRFGPGVHYAYFSPHFHTLASGWTEPAHVANLSKWGRAESDPDRLRRVAKDMRRALDLRRAAGDSGGDLSKYRRVLKIPRADRYVYRSVSTVSTALDIFSLMRYLLTHCAVADKRHALSYWGAAQNRYFRADSVLVSAANAPDSIHKTIETYVDKDMMIESANLELWRAPGGDVAEAARLESVEVGAAPELLNSLGAMIAAARPAPHDHGPAPTLDNAPKPQNEGPAQITSSEAAYCIVGRLRLRDGTGPARPAMQGPPAAPEPAPAPEYHKEKCPPKEVVFAWYLDASTDSLCQICYNPLRSVLLDGTEEWARPAGPGPPEPIQAMLSSLAEGAPERIQRVVDRGLGRYVGPGDYTAGLPYFVVSETGGVVWSLDVGLARPGPHYDKSAAPIRAMQDAEIEASRWNRIVKDVKRDALDKHLPVYFRKDGSGRIQWDWDWLNMQVALTQNILPPARLPRPASQDMRPLVGGGFGAHA